MEKRYVKIYMLPAATNVTPINPPTTVRTCLLFFPAVVDNSSISGVYSMMGYF